MFNFFRRKNHFIYVYITYIHTFNEVIIKNIVSQANEQNSEVIFLGGGVVGLCFTPEFSKYTVRQKYSSSFINVKKGNHNKKKKCVSLFRVVKNEYADSHI